MQEISIDRHDAAELVNGFDVLAAIIDGGLVRMIGNDRMKPGDEGIFIRALSGKNHEMKKQIEAIRVKL